MPKLNAVDSGFGPYARGASRPCRSAVLGDQLDDEHGRCAPSRSGPRASASRSIGSCGSPKSLKSLRVAVPGVEQVGVGEGDVAQADARRIRRAVASWEPEYRRCRLPAGRPARYDPGHEPATPRRRRPAADGQVVGEPGRAADPRGDGRRRVRGPAVSRRAAADRGRQRGRRLGDGPPDAQERRRRAALDRVGQGGSPAARRARGDARAGAADIDARRGSGCGATTLATVARGEPGHRTGQRRGAHRSAASPAARRERPRSNGWSARSTR